MQNGAQQTQPNIQAHLSLIPSQPNKRCFFLVSFSHGGARLRMPRPWQAASCARPHPSPTPMTTLRSRGSLSTHLGRHRRRRRRSPRPWRARSGPTSLRTPTFPSISGTRTRRRTRRGGPSGSASPPGSRPSDPAASTGHGTAQPQHASARMAVAKRGAGRKFSGNLCRRRRWRRWWRGTGTVIAHGRSIWVSFFLSSQYQNGVYF